VERATVFEAVPHWSPAVYSGTTPVGARLPTEKTVWPFRELLAEPLATEHGRVTVAVVDSGIDRDPNHPSEPDPRFRYYRGSVFGPDSQLQLGRAGCGPIPFGCNLVSRGSFPADDLKGDDPDTAEMQFHGTHVSGIALGRPVPQLKTVLDERLQLMVLKVIDANGKADSGDVAEALRIAAQNGAQVVNVSLSGRRAEVVEDQMKEMVSQLFVVAAGIRRAVRACRWTTLARTKRWDTRRVWRAGCRT